MQHGGALARLERPGGIQIIRQQIARPGIKCHVHSPQLSTGPERPQRKNRKSTYVHRHCPCSEQTDDLVAQAHTVRRAGGLPRIMSGLYNWFAALCNEKMRHRWSMTRSRDASDDEPGARIFTTAAALRR